MSRVRAPRAIPLRPRSTALRNWRLWPKRDSNVVIPIAASATQPAAVSRSRSYAGDGLTRRRPRRRWRAISRTNAAGGRLSRTPPKVSSAPSGISRTAASSESTLRDMPLPSPYRRGATCSGGPDAHKRPPARRRSPGRQGQDAVRDRANLKTTSSSSRGASGCSVGSHVPG